MNRNVETIPVSVFSVVLRWFYPHLPHILVQTHRTWRRISLVNWTHWKIGALWTVSVLLVAYMKEQLAARLGLGLESELSSKPSQCEIPHLIFIRVAKQLWNNTFCIGWHLILCVIKWVFWRNIYLVTLSIWIQAITSSCSLSDPVHAVKTLIFVFNALIIQLH